MGSYKRSDPLPSTTAMPLPSAGANRRFRPSIEELTVFMPRLRRGNAECVTKLNCQTEPAPGGCPVAAGNGTAEKRIAFDDAATERGKRAVALSAIGPIPI